MPKSTNFLTESILNEIEENENGTFHIKNVDGNAYLIVHKPGKRGKPIDIQDVFHRLKLFGIDSFEKNYIETIVRAADGKPYRISDWTGGTPIDSIVEFEISSDKMHAYVKMLPPRHGGKTFSYEEIFAMLKARGIVHGLKETVLKEFVERQIFFVKTLIAEGTPPISGLHGFIEVLFEKKDKPVLHQDEKGRVDFKDLGIIKHVSKGEMIAKRIQSQAGAKGKDVYGIDMEAPDLQSGVWKYGTNCKLSQDGESLFSTIDGRPVVDRDGTIRVDEVCHLDKVDYSTGNIDFPGTIIVDGSIADNFRLSTKGSIIIKKSVGKVFLFAEGDIVLSGGVMGRNGGLIESKSDVYAKFVEQGKIKAAKSIFIEEAAMHSQLIAGEAVLVKGRRGELIGGDTVAGSYIAVSKLGTIVETKTSIVVGISPEILNILDKMKDDVSYKEEVLKKIRSTMSKLTDSAMKRELKPEEKDYLKRLTETEKKYAQQFSESFQEYEAMLASYEPNEDSYIDIEKVLYPRVNINLGKGKIFNSELKTIEGKNYIYLAPDGFPFCTTIPPKVLQKKKKDEKEEKKP